MARKHEKRVATPVLMHYRRLMASKHPKASKLGDLLENLSVEEMDAYLLEIKRNWNRTFAMRMIRAEEEGITTPPPSPPGIDAPKTEPGINRINARIPPPTSPIGELRLIAGSAADEVFKIILRYPHGLSTPILREEFEKTEFAKTATPGAKPYHYGLQRLKMTGHVVTHKGKIFYYQHLEKFKEDVAAGRVPDIIEVRKLHSKWALAIMEYLKMRETELVTYKEICDRVASLPEFKDNKSIEEQTAVALRNLIHRNMLVEKIKGKSKKPLYRIKPEASTAQETDETFWGAEADASTPRH
jgi:hypothetical protein